MAIAPTGEDKSLIANVTVSNVQDAPVPCTYTKFFLVDKQGSTYYANYAVCDRMCGADARKNRTLRGHFSGDLYVLFSVSANAEVMKLIYASSPRLR